MQANRPKTWKTHFFEGLLLVGCGGFIFWYFVDFENSHDASRRMNWIVATIYNFGGKWLVLAIVLLLAASEFVTAWRKRLQG